MCLFDEQGQRETARIALPEYTNQNMARLSARICGRDSSTAIRVHGPYDPKNGHRFNHNKLLLDPYAKRLIGRFIWNDALYGYSVGHARRRSIVRSRATARRSCRNASSRTPHIPGATISRRAVRGPK